MLPGSYEMSLASSKPYRLQLYTVVRSSASYYNSIASFSYPYVAVCLKWLMSKWATIQLCLISATYAVHCNVCTMFLSVSQCHTIKACDRRGGRAPHMLNLSARWTRLINFMLQLVSWIEAKCILELPCHKEKDKHGNHECPNTE